MTPEEWAETALRLKHNRKPDQQIAIGILRAILRNETSPTQAARDVASTYAPGMRKETGQPGYAYCFWDLFCHCVRHVGSSAEHSEQLADLLHSIIDLPDLLDDDGRPVTAPGGLRYWRDLPHFGWCWRDSGNWETFNYICMETVIENKDFC